MPTGPRGCARTRPAEGGRGAGGRARGDRRIPHSPLIGGTAVTVIALTLAALPLRAGIIGAAEKDRFRLPSGRAEVDQAIACFQRRDYEQAFQLLKAAADKDPDLFPARLMFAKLYFLNGQVAEGRAHLERSARRGYPACPDRSPGYRAHRYR